MSTHTSRITIQAPAENVWEALTNPELVKKWQYGSGLITDWQVGSEIRFRVEWEGTLFEQWGTVLEVVPHQLITYTLFAPRPGLEDKPENYFIMSYSLTDKDQSTLLSIKQTDNRPGASEQDSNEDGDNAILNALKAVVEGQ
ncbi:UNVERIFIED_CONTAM: uncharacterized protein YndB with AHSA1/START domain [Brevibacillus sp. OAP136]